MRVDLVPYGYRPSPGAAAQARALLVDLFGSRMLLHAAEPAGYGERPEPAGPGPGESGCVAVLVSLAQSPEWEVHGELIETLRRRMDQAPGEGRVVLLLDEEPYRERLGANAPRLAERRRAWERLATEAGISLVPLSGRGAPDDDTLRRARAALERVRQEELP
jgi:hypothetical protein